MKSFKDFLLCESKQQPKNINELIEMINSGVKLSEIDTSKVTNMSDLFTSACRNVKDFKGIENWDVSNVEDFSNMFGYADLKGINLSKWNTSKAISMRNMFHECKGLHNIGIEKWNVSKVKRFWGMFKNCTDFNSDISKWDTSSAIDMALMFDGCTKFDQKLKWNVRNVKTMEYMFHKCTSLSEEQDFDIPNGCNTRSMYLRTKFDN